MVGVVTTQAPPSGTYSVRVDNWENCLHKTVDYVVTVRHGTDAPITKTGTFPYDPNDQGTWGDNGGAGSGVPVLSFTIP